MNKFIKTISLSLLLGFSFTSCEDILDDNVNPDIAHTNTIDQALPVIMFYASQTVYDHADYNVYLSQCLTTMGKSQKGSGYPYKDGWEFLTVNRHPQWRRHYYDIAKNIRAEGLCDISENGTRNVDLIARAIILMSTHLTTDTFGDMPMLPEQGGNAHLSSYPHYESQPYVYSWMLKEADALIAAFEAYQPSDKDVAIDKTMDRIYAGDVNKWKGFAYALKARLLLRNIPNVNTTPAMCNEIIATAQKAINIWREGDLLYGNWFGNEPRYNYDGGSGEQNAPWSKSEPIINQWESRANRFSKDVVPSKFFMEACLGVSFPGNERKQGTWDRNNGYSNDPRMMLIMAPADGPISAAIENKAWMYRYLENNIGAGSTFKRPHYPDLYAGAYAGSNDSYNILFTMEELHFIIAEAKYWLNDKAGACALAKEAAQWNIQRHLDFYILKKGAYPGQKCLISATPDQQALDKARFEAMMGAFLNNEPTTIVYTKADGKVSSITAKACTEFGNERWFFNPSEFSLSDLMMQKYIAMYLQPEQWTDMRRYHYSNNRNGIGIGQGEIVYPTLRRPYNLYAPYWVDGLTDEEKEKTWVQRLNYDPQTEETFNKSEVERVGAYQNHLWLRKPMIWAMNPGERTDLVSE